MINHIKCDYDTHFYEQNFVQKHEIESKFISACSLKKKRI